MTEQPPPSASKEALELVSRLRKQRNKPWPGGTYSGDWHELNLLDAGKAIDALCEQRVSAETERCAALVKPSMAFEECVYLEAIDNPEFQKSIAHADDFIRLGLTGILRREFRDV